MSSLPWKYGLLAVGWAGTLFIGRASKDPTGPTPSIIHSIPSELQTTRFQNALWEERIDVYPPNFGAPGPPLVVNTCSLFSDFESIFAPTCPIPQPPPTLVVHQEPVLLPIPTTQQDWYVTPACINLPRYLCRPRASLVEYPVDVLLLMLSVTVGTVLFHLVRIWRLSPSERCLYKGNPRSLDNPPPGFSHDDIIELYNDIDRLEHEIQDLGENIVFDAQEKEILNKQSVELRQELDTEAGAHSKTISDNQQEKDQLARKHAEAVKKLEQRLADVDKAHADEIESAHKRIAELESQNAQLIQETSVEAQNKESQSAASSGSSAKSMEDEYKQLLDASRADAQKYRDELKRVNGTLELYSSDSAKELIRLTRQKTKLEKSANDALAENDRLRKEKEQMQEEAAAAKDNLKKEKANLQEQLEASEQKFGLEKALMLEQMKVTKERGQEEKAAVDEELKACLEQVKQKEDEAIQCKESHDRAREAQTTKYNTLLTVTKRLKAETDGAILLKQKITAQTTELSNKDKLIACLQDRLNAKATAVEKQSVAQCDAQVETPESKSPIPNTPTPKTRTSKTPESATRLARGWVQTSSTLSEDVSTPVVNFPSGKRSDSGKRQSDVGPRGAKTTEPAPQGADDVNKETVSPLAHARSDANVELPPSGSPESAPSTPTPASRRSESASAALLTSKWAATPASATGKELSTIPVTSKPKPAPSSTKTPSEPKTDSPATAPASPTGAPLHFKWNSAAEFIPRGALSADAAVFPSPTVLHGAYVLPDFLHDQPIQVPGQGQGQGQGSFDAGPLVQTPMSLAGFDAASGPVEGSPQQGSTPEPQIPQGPRGHASPAPRQRDLGPQ